MGLIVKHPSKLARLSIGVRSGLCIAAHDQRSVQIPGHEQIRGHVVVKQLRGVPRVCQTVGKTLIRMNLSGDVVIARTRGLDHHPAVGGVNVEDRRVDEIPTHVSAQTSVGKPAGNVGGLFVTEPLCMP